MGKNRRQERLRERRTQPAAPARPASRAAGKPMPAWRHSLQQWGGPWVIGVGVLVLTFIGWLVWANRPVSVSSDDLKGDEVQILSSAHVASASELQIPEGVPPAGGPHFVDPLPGGVYDSPIDDGRVIHSLEHGLIWVTYRPDGLSEDELKALKAFAAERKRDMVLSPRPANRDTVVAVSWGRRAVLKPGDLETLKAFFSTNLNRSPEPGVR